MTLIAIDHDGIYTKVENLALTIDTTAPAAPTIQGPANAGAAVSDLIGTAEAYSRVTVHDQGSLLGTVQADASGAWRLADVSYVGSGHSFTARAADAAGNLSAAATYTGTLALSVDRSAVTLAEAGGSADIVLRAVNVAEGTTSLTVSLAGLDATEARASARSVVLDVAHGWAATLTLTGRDDADADGDVARTLTFSAPGATGAAMTVTTLDDEIAAAAYTRVGRGPLDTALFAAKDGQLLTTTETQTAAGSYVIDQRWRFDLPTPGDAVLHMKGSSTEVLRLLASTDDGATWQSIAGAPARAKAWNGNWLIHDVTDTLLIRLVDIRTKPDMVQDSVKIDLMTVTPEHALIA